MFDRKKYEKALQLAKSGKFNEALELASKIPYQYPSIMLDDIEKLIGNNDDMASLKKANKLMNKRKSLLKKFLGLKGGLEKLNEKIEKLTEKFSKGEGDSDAFKIAHDDLEREKKEIEEELWKLRNKLFKEEYEKPF